MYKWKCYVDEVGLENVHFLVDEQEEWHGTVLFHYGAQKWTFEHIECPKCDYFESSDDAKKALLKEVTLLKIKQQVNLLTQLDKIHDVLTNFNSMLSAEDQQIEKIMLLVPIYSLKAKKS